MKRILTTISIYFCALTICCANNQGLFRTSKCYDLLSSIQNFDSLKEFPQFSSLAADTSFVKALAAINDNTRASKLCNAYSLYGYDKNNIEDCIKFLTDMPDIIPVGEHNSSWINSILGIRPQLLYVVNSLVTAGYSDYWDTCVFPRLNDKINSYYADLPKHTVDKINSEISAFAAPEILTETNTNIYILDIQNAFNLLDETFCCTPLLLDSELEKTYHFDFLKVYIHENLHRLNVSNALMERLSDLAADDFYKEHEETAMSHNEGGNEAFVVAAEVFLSHKLGRRSDKDVVNEFKEYVDGSLVLAPIIYVHLEERLPTETYNEFLLRLFDNGTLSVGNIETEYNAAMNLLLTRIN